MIHYRNLPILLGDAYDPTAHYAMVETNATRSTFPSPRKGPGSWTSVGEFGDPDIASTKTFYIYVWTIPPTKETTQ